MGSNILLIYSSQRQLMVIGGFIGWAIYSCFTPKRSQLIYRAQKLENFEFHLVRGELQFGGIERLARQWISLFLSRPSCGTRRGWSCCRQTYHRLGRCDRPEPYPRSSSSESRSRTFYGNSKNKFIQYSKSITQMQLISC